MSRTDTAPPATRGRTTPQPEEVAPAYVFLASEADSSFIAGIVLQGHGRRDTGG